MIKVLIVDDSAVTRTVVAELIDKQPDLKTVGTASDPYFARDRIKKLNPDIVILDINMPRMDGITFLDKLMKYRPLPVIMLSSYTVKGAKETLRALSLGAVDFISKPKTDLRQGLIELQEEIVKKIRLAVRAKVRPRMLEPIQVDPKLTIDEVFRRKRRIGHEANLDRRIICIGASTGGTQAIEYILSRLSGENDGMAIVQHMPAGFTSAFAQRLKQNSGLEVLEGEDGMSIQRGRVVIAPGGRHLLVEAIGGHFRVVLKSGQPVNRHAPSVDVLFRSAANAAGQNAIGFLLTGMGDDGAKGLMDIKEAGGLTYAQDEQSCVVFGMPKVAIAMGAAHHVVPLASIPNIISASSRTLDNCRKVGS